MVVNKNQKNNALILDYPPACSKVTILRKHFCVFCTVCIFLCVREGFTLNETCGTGQADQPQQGTETQLRDAKSKPGVQEKVLAFADDMLV